ncbi:MAG: DUF2167 domain-containing protein [Alphaproteobacteria bacterium]|nr:DUF2167 domain-containing protein [Alphaproteobacteria bacterium]
MLVRSVLTASALSTVLFCAVAVADIPPPQPGTEVPASEPLVPPPVTDPTEVPAPSVDDATAPEAKEAPSPQELAANSLTERDGTIVLPGGQASVVVAEGFAFLDATDATKLLVEVWGNPPGAAEGVLGAIVPKGVSPLAPESWAAMITYDNDGHVSDDDAASINYDDLLKEMQSDTAAGSEERVKQGYPAISLVGWAQKPSYDAAGHKLHWAKHLKFGTEDETLNYAIRALGRTGVLQLNVIAGMNQLPDINANVPKMLSMVSFNEGHRYADFDAANDPVAAYGLAALVAGGIAAKAGLLKGLLVFLAASWKFVLMGLLAFGAAIRGVVARMFGGKPKEPSV